MPEVTGSTDKETEFSKPKRPAAMVDQLEEQQFGVPPSLIIGIITSLFGAGAGVVSLIIFFYVWKPEAYVSPEWLVFVLTGAFAGFFMRLERPLFRELYRKKL